MNRLLLAALLVPILATVAAAQFDDGPARRNLSFRDVVTKVEASVEPATARRGETVTWRLRLNLIPGWHTYPTRQVDPNAASQVNTFKFPAPGDVAFVDQIQEPPNPIKEAERALDITELRSYQGTVVWERKLVVSPAAHPGEQIVLVPVTILACEKSCLPPEKLVTEAKLTVSDAPPIPVDPKYADAFMAAGPRGADTAPPAPTAAPSGDYSKALADLEAQTVVGEQSAAPKNTGLGAFLITAAAWGLISLVTPCVFPMIPITVSYFLKQSDKQHLSPLLQALVYCGTIVIVLGVAALTLLSFFRAMSVHWLTNFLLGALFVVLALSLFGMFELTLPNALTRWTSAREGKGGLVGTVFMALTFTVVSFTCVAPFLGGFAGIADSGQFSRLEMLLGALTFSGAFAAPFFLLALFPSLLRKLPRSGGWLNCVKVVMGFLELAAALVFFRTAELRLPWGAQFFTYDFVLGLWVALAVLCGLYLINLFRIGHDEPLESVSVPRFLFGFLFCGLGLYLLPGLFAGADGQRHRPDGVVFAWVDAFLLPETSRGDLPWKIDLPRAVAEARAERIKTGQRQLVFVDFTGVTCKNCKYNEKAVFSKADVKELFRPYRLVQMYTDEVPAEFYLQKPTEQQREADAAANLAFQRRKFLNDQLPLYVILEPQADGKVTVVDIYKEGKINQLDQFVEFLKRPVAPDTARAAK